MCFIHVQKQNSKIYIKNDLNNQLFFKDGQAMMVGEIFYKFKVGYP